MERDFDKPVAMAGFTVQRTSVGSATGVRHVKETIVVTERGGVFVMNDEEPVWSALPPIPGSYYHASMLKEDE